MKSYTDIEQSKKLVEILPVESADMCYRIVAYNPNDTHEYQPYCFIGTLESDIPCWSLAALLSVLPDEISLDNETYHLNCNKEKVTYLGHMTWDGQLSITSKANTIVDAGVEMILKLYELNLL